jgi:hypothetical protein
MAYSSDFARSRTNPGGRGYRADSDADAPLDALATERPRGRSAQDDHARSAAIFGAGVAVGAFLGASAALLFAPQAGEDTRELIAERAHRFGGRVSDRLDDARDDLGWYLRRSRRKLGRRLARGRWRGQDVADRLRKRF